MSDLISTLKAHAPFNQMAPEHLKQLARQGRTLTLQDGEVAITKSDTPADRLFIVLSGAIDGERPDAKEQEPPLWSLSEGELFPIGALLGDRATRNRYRARGESTLLALEKSDFMDLIHHSPPFSDFCSRRIANLLDQALSKSRAQTAQQLGQDNALDTPIERLLRRTPITAGTDESLENALTIMRRENIGSMVIVDEAHRPVGVFTLRDLLSRVVLERFDLSRPIREVATANPVTLPKSAFAFEAAMVMADHGFHHLCIVDETGVLAGVISEGDLFSLQRVSLANLSRAIQKADSVEALSAMRTDIQTLIGQMIAGGVQIDQITQIITLLNDHLTRRIIDLIIAQRGQPAVAFSWLSFGSEGRGEQTLKTDQDNGILFEVPAGSDPEAIRQGLLPLATAINEALDRCGFPLCEGNIMASNPECCLSLKEWEARFGRWIDQGTPEHLLKSSIFFDFRVLWGAEAPAETLRKRLLEKTAKNSRFLRQMAAGALQNRPPLGLLGDFKLAGKGAHQGMLDLKKSGITPFVDAARIIALSAEIGACGTTQRLEAAAKSGALKSEDAQSWLSAYRYIQLLRVQAHHDQGNRQVPLSNYIAPKSLSDLESRVLKEAFRQIRKLQGLLEVRYQL